MPNVKEIVAKMLERGMSAEEVRSNLKQLGFANADQILAEVRGGAPKKEEPAGGSGPSGFSMTSIDDSGEEKELNLLADQGAEGAPEEVTTGSYDSIKIAKQLDEAIGLMKSIEKLNKQILKSNQDILDKLEK